MDEGERTEIRHVLSELRDGGEEWSRKRLGSNDQRKIASRFEPVNRNRLRYLLSQPSGQFDPHEVIQVEPPRREWLIAVLWCSWKTEGDGSGCTFYLGGWLESGRFVGFRFEPPAEGNHNYYHSQPCRSMGNREPISGALEMPERNPTWPLPATSSLELLLCLVLSIHGMDGLKRIRQTFSTDPMQYRALICTMNKMVALSSA